MRPAQTLLFRFFFVYFILYIFPWPIWLLPGAEGIAGVLTRPITTFVPWFADVVLGLDRPAVDHPTGSGDTLFAFVSLLVNGGLAVVLTGLWSALERPPADHRRLADALRVAMRFFL